MKTRFPAVLMSLFLLSVLSMALPALATELVVDGDFEGHKNGAQLRKDGKGSDWYESRKDTEEGSKLAVAAASATASAMRCRAIIVGS